MDLVNDVAELIETLNNLKIEEMLTLAAINHAVYAVLSDHKVPPCIDDKENEKCVSRIGVKTYLSDTPFQKKGMVTKLCAEVSKDDNALPSYITLPTDYVSWKAQIINALDIPMTRIKFSSTETVSNVGTKENPFYREFLSYEAEIYWKHIVKEKTDE